MSEEQLNCLKSEIQCRYSLIMLSRKTEWKGENSNFYTFGFSAVTALP